MENCRSQPKAFFAMTIFLVGQAATLRFRHLLRRKLSRNKKPPHYDFKEIRADTDAAGDGDLEVDTTAFVG